MSPRNLGALLLLCCAVCVVVPVWGNQALQIVPQSRPQDDLVLHPESGSHVLSTSVPAYSFFESSDVRTTNDIALKVR